MDIQEWRQIVSDKLTLLQIASCTCCTKTPIIKYHNENCKYRIACELEELIIDFYENLKYEKPRTHSSRERDILVDECEIYVKVGENNEIKRLARRCSDKLKQDKILIDSLVEAMNRLYNSLSKS